MAGRLNIFVNEKAIDLYPGEIFTLTLQAFDVISLTGAKADYSKTISVPDTPNNTKIFGITNVIGSQSIEPYSKLPAKVIQNGIEIIPSGTCLLESHEGKSFQITIYSGALSIADLLKNISLQGLSFSPDLDFDFSFANIFGFAKTTSGVLWAVADYADQAPRPRPNSLDGRYSFFSVYVHSILSRITDLFGITVIGIENFTEPNFFKLVLPIVNAPKVPVLWRERMGFQAERTTEQIFTLTTNIIFDTVISGNSNESYNPANGLFQDQRVFKYRVSYRVNGVKLGTGTDVFQFITANGDYTEQSLSDPGEFSIDIQWESIYPGLGALLYLRCVLPASGDQITISSGSSVLLEVLPEAVNYEDQVSNRGSLISVGLSLPDISAWDFINSLRQIYSSIQTSNQIQKSVTLTKFDKLVSNPTIDWSEKLDVSKPYQIAFRSTGLAQINWFRYIDEGGDELIDADSFFLISDRNLDNEKTVIQLPFAPSLPTIYEGFLTMRISINSYEEVKSGVCSLGATTQGFVTVQLDSNEGIKINDQLLVVNGRRGMVVSVDNINKTNILVYAYFTLGTPSTSNLAYRILRTSTGEVSPRIGVVYNGKESSINYSTGGVVSELVSNPYMLKFIDTDPAIDIDLRWSKLLEQNWGSFIQRVQQEKILEGYFNLTEVDIQSFNPLNPIAINKFGSLFYLNKIDRWRNDQSTKCQLVSLHYGFGGNEITLWTNDITLPYDRFTSNRSTILRAQKETGTAIAKSNNWEVLVGEVYRLTYVLEYFDDFAMNFTAIRTIDFQYNATVTVNFDNVINGNVGGYYSPINGQYTLASSFDGRVSSRCTVTDLPASGGTTIQLLSSTKGILDQYNLPNNQTATFTLQYTGTFTIGEILTVHIITSGAIVRSGSNFAMQYLANGDQINIAPVLMVLKDSFTNQYLTQQVTLNQTGQQFEFTVFSDSNNAYLEVETASAVDYALSVFFEKISAGG